MDTNTMSWWYKRSIGEIEQKKVQQTYQSVALIAGVTGITGSSLAEALSLADTPGGQWKVYGVARHPCPEWLSTLHVDYIQCDISKSEETYSKLSPLKDITHIFYVSYAGSDNVARNTLMFQNILDSIIPNASNLKHVAICKHESKPLVYTGTRVSWTCLWDAVDSGLLADHLIWAGTDPKARNEVFNVNNGDVFKWKHMWEVLGEQFGIESVGYEEGKEAVSLKGLMKDKDVVWDEIVKKHDLVPTKLKDIAAFWVVDVVFSLTEMLSSMNKNKEFGFLGFRDSTKSFVNCVNKMRDYRFIP